MMSLSRFPFILLFLSVSLSAIGALLLHSAAGGDFMKWSFRHIQGTVLGILVVIFLAKVDIKVIYKYSYHIYLITILLLCAVLLFGHKAMGAQRWLNFGFFMLQPSEFAKVGLVLALAKFYHQLHFFDSVKARSILVPFCMTLIPSILILKQPNLGTASVLFLMLAVITFTAGVNIYLFLFSLIMFCISLPGIWFLLHDYQKQRILTFLNPESDPFGAGYNVIQSKIAIGSGGFWGKGFMQGSQSQLHFLPENQTDFIISLLAEEMGMLGLLLVLFLMIALILALYFYTQSFFSQYARMIVIGAASFLFFHVIINLMMVSGIFPVAGLPFPFLSYGRSHLLTCFIMIGLCCNAVVHRKDPLKLK